MDEERYESLKYRVDEVMHYIWDPIGVSGTPEVRDEYSSYADRVWRDILEGKTVSEIATYLTSVTTERMGLEARKEHDYEVATILLDWARFLKHPYEL